MPWFTAVFRVNFLIMENGEKDLTNIMSASWGKIWAPPLPLCFVDLAKNLGLEGNHWNLYRTRVQSTWKTLDSYFLTFLRTVKRHDQWWEVDLWTQLFWYYSVEPVSISQRIFLHYTSDYEWTYMAQPILSFLSLLIGLWCTFWLWWGSVSVCLVSVGVGLVWLVWLLRCPCPCCCWCWPACPWCCTSSPSRASLPLFQGPASPSECLLSTTWCHPTINLISHSWSHRNHVKIEAWASKIERKFPGKDASRILEEEDKKPED